MIHVAQLTDGNVVYECKCQGDQHQHQTGQEFSQHQLSCTYRLGQQQFDRARFLFLGEHFHGQRRDEEKQGPFGDGKEHLEVGFLSEKNISSVYPGEKSAETQKRNDEDIGGQRIKKRAELFEGNDLYR